MPGLDIILPDVEPIVRHRDRLDGLLLTHFEAVLADGGGWRERIRGLRANASRLSHAELDEATELDSGDPHELGSDYRRLLARLPALAVFGGRCGTADRHVAAMAQAVVPQRSARPTRQTIGEGQKR